MTEKPPLLLLHGVTMSAAAWDAVAPLLDDRFDLIVPTAAGHRGGPPLQGRPTISALVDATEALLDERGLATVHVAGNSMGGWIAVELARRGRARSVCAFSPAGFWTAGERDETHATNMLRHTRKLSAATRFVAPAALGVPLVRRLAMRFVAERADRLTRRQAVESMRDLLGCDAADDLLGTTEQVEPLGQTCPMTIAWADGDRIFPPEVNGVTARERIPHAHFVMLRGVGHVPMIDDPALCARTIIDATGHGGPQLRPRGSDTSAVPRRLP
ncbi:alpha/beta hydrolase [Mycobacterium sp. ITM-2016-00316]|uniref:alpha/beta fold hydrolase n=1 Tax=Mycobacterium sp. ITM-2016-00316 TaxID=2099695 RepID=UPI001E53C19F|nr:alpha/beta hydrolase [Mycobacterium sp. ITM-2016-00316]WNG82169.1 alpha/beta hydrolase [Mycobacterium sp. ITM-2016-00316]